MYIKLLALNVVFRLKTNNQNTKKKKQSKNKINKTNTKQTLQTLHTIFPQSDATPTISVSLHGSMATI